MAGFGSRENRILICLFGFLFFAMLPFINMSLDYFIRVNVAKDAQGRVWGLIGIISQIGNVIAFAAIGQVADVLFVPLLEKDGPLAGTVGALIGVGKGRGFGSAAIRVPRSSIFNTTPLWAGTSSRLSRGMTTNGAIPTALATSR